MIFRFLPCWVSATSPFNSLLTLQVSAASQCQGVEHRDAKEVLLQDAHGNYAISRCFQPALGGVSLQKKMN